MAQHEQHLARLRVKAVLRELATCKEQERIAGQEAVRLWGLGERRCALWYPRWLSC